MKHFVKRWFARRGALPLTCYLLALAAWLAVGAVHAGGWPAAAALCMSKPSPLRTGSSSA